jgi:hypothetical protein
LKTNDKNNDHTTTTTTTTIKGYKSGRRSGLIKINNIWYRLKGCGNDNNGFEEQQMANGGVEVRGCMFTHTSYRELYITDFLRQHDLSCANAPIGWWKYYNNIINSERNEDSNFTSNNNKEDDANDASNNKEKLQDNDGDGETMKVTCSCALFMTVGDRRFGDHVLFGLESLFPFMLDPALLSLLMTCFPPSRVTNSDGNLPEGNNALFMFVIVSNIFVQLQVLG